tara:strand:- start:1366 stop:2010 length:645 start_codon:yes stop_codon:yes gene_type:complete
MAFYKLLTKGAKKAIVKAANKKQVAEGANKIQKTLGSIAASKGVKKMPKKYTMAFINKQPAGMKKELMKERKRFLAAREAAAKNKGAKKSSAMGSRFESIPKKSDKRIEGSGSQSARPKGSIGKTRTQDRPRGSVAGLSMGDARKAQARKNQPGNIKNKKVAMARRYDDLLVGVKRAAVAALRAGDREKARKILSGTGISVSDFISVIRQRGKM